MHKSTEKDPYVIALIWLDKDLSLRLLETSLRYDCEPAMNRYLKILITFIVVTVPLATQAASQTRFKVVYSTITPPTAPLWIARDKGLFEKHGLSVEMVYIESGPRSVQALLSGDALIATTAGPAVANAKLSGAQVVMIAGLTDVFPFFLVTHKRISSPAELRGKVGATQVLGSGGDLALRMGLRSLGLDPEKDVQLRAIGASGLRIQALERNLVDFAMLEPMVMFQAQRSNLKVLVDFTDKGIPYQHSGIVTLESSLKDKRPQILGFLKAVVEGIAFYKRNGQETIAMMAKYTGIRDRETLATSYEWFKKTFPDVPYPTVEGFKAILDMIRPSRKDIPKLDPKALVDQSLLDELVKDGFFRSLNQ
jgi:ABC-type nitrate/sulfonate/bicarbonate transport system substrate-binding protein